MVKKYKIPCEIYTRAVGYFRPIKQMNIGKQAEIKDRKMLDLSKIGCTTIKKGHEIP